MNPHLQHAPIRRTRSGESPSTGNARRAFCLVVPLETEGRFVASRTARFSTMIALAVSLTCATAVAGFAPASAAPIYPIPDGDGFYSAPANLGSVANGDVLRTRTVPAVGFPGSTAWQIEYRSENSAGNPIAAVTTVLMGPIGGPNRPLVSYQPFTNALGLQCAPSHTLFDGGDRKSVV